MNITPENIYLVIALTSIMFSVFLYFKTPQEDLETKQALTDKEVDNKATILAQKEVENKAGLLAQQLQWEKEANQRRFIEMQENIKEVFLLASNHIHSVELKVDGLVETVSRMGNEMVKLATIIEERVTKK